jgi:hypothetical protein
MLAAVNSIINEQEAMLRQIGFLRWYSVKWKRASGQKESDQQALTQLVQTTYYLKEGLEELYSRSDNLTASHPGFFWEENIQHKRLTVMDSLDKIYRELVDFNSNMLQATKECISESIDSLCQMVTGLSAQENETLKSRLDRLHISCN